MFLETCCPYIIHKRQVTVCKDNCIPSNPLQLSQLIVMVGKEMKQLFHQKPVGKGESNQLSLSSSKIYLHPLNYQLQKK